MKMVHSDWRRTGESRIVKSDEATIRVNDPKRAGSMSRFADLFVALCIVAISASVGIVMYYLPDLQAITSAVMTIVLAFMLLLINLRTFRQQDRVALNATMEQMNRRLDQIAAEFDSIERRVAAVETQAPRRAKQDLEPVVAEVEVIGALIRQVVETVADLEAQVGGTPRVRPAATTEVVDMERPMPLADRAGFAATVPEDVADLVPKRFATLGEEGYLAIIKQAIEANRIDLHLQPVVTLPQRKIRFYETLTRLRTADGDTLYPADYIPIAEKYGAMPQLDVQILTRTVQIVRRLTQRTKEVGCFCNISATSLGDGRFFSDMRSVLEANRSMAEELVLEFTQRSLKTLGPLEFEGLRSIQALGFHFSLDRVQDMRSSFQFLAERGFRYAKISADRLLNASESLSSDIHPADLASYFSRFGMELIADHIETEPQVVDILDFGIKFGQGFLFSPPRPVKSDLTNASASDASSAQAAQVRNALAQARGATANGAGATAAIPTMPPVARTQPLTPGTTRPAPVAQATVPAQQQRRPAAAPPPPTPPSAAQQTEAALRAARARQMGVVPTQGQGR
jgi:cyclic-di-GMP phosphodiesterase TipF (flagellum assembly factor)